TGLRRRHPGRTGRRRARRASRRRGEVPWWQGGRDRVPRRSADAEGGRIGGPEARAGRPAPAPAGVIPRGGTSPHSRDRIPAWRLVVLGMVRAFEGLVTHPLARMWTSSDPIDAYGLNHLTSVAGDALLAFALADSVFFHVPVAESRVRVALFLGLTMLPLALAGPLIVPILDRAGP